MCRQACAPGILLLLAGLVAGVAEGFAVAVTALRFARSRRPRQAKSERVDFIAGAGNGEEAALEGSPEDAISRRVSGVGCVASECNLW
jgi:F0F1-type ATP synthase membrane subunit c/vacuolar-type H+-ATPase subunit K